MAKSKFGRPPKYTVDSFRRKAEAYVEQRENGLKKGPITLLDFCCYAGVYKDYISEHDLEGTELEATENNFSETIKMLKTKAENSIQYNAMLWLINSTMAIFSLKNYGWKDETQQSVTQQVIHIKEPNPE